MTNSIQQLFIVTLFVVVAGMLSVDWLSGLVIDMSATILK